MVHDCRIICYSALLQCVCVCVYVCVQTSSDGGVDPDPLSLPTADHEQDGFVMVDLTDIVYIHA